jgi:hypothetical protein
VIHINAGIDKKNKGSETGAVSKNSSAFDKATDQKNTGIMAVYGLPMIKLATM